MSDIVERLERGVVWISACVCDGDGAEITMKEAAAEITRLRTELAEAQCDTDDLVKELADMILERDALLQQLAVAREGLEQISDDWGDGGPSIAADTLAKLDQMEAKP